MEKGLEKTATLFYRLSLFYRKLARYLEQQDATLAGGRWFELYDIPMVEKRWLDEHYTTLSQQVERELEDGHKGEKIGQELSRDLNAVFELVNERVVEENPQENKLCSALVDWRSRASILRTQLLRRSGDFAKFSCECEP